MRVFVTGGTGFVGAHVVPALQRSGHEVVALVRDPRKAASVLGAAAATFVAGDLADSGALARSCAGADAVVHLAGLTAARSRAELFGVNEGGTRALVAAARSARVSRLVYVSSLAAAGPVANDVVPSGGEEPRPVSDYGRSKLAGEVPVRESPLAWTILRPPAVYGPWDREFLRLFRLVRRGVAPVFGDGTQRLSLVYGGDLADAIVACLATTPPAGVYYPAHRDTTTTRSLLASIATALAKRVRILSIPRAVVRPMLALTGTTARLLGQATLLSADKANELLADAWLCAPGGLERAVGWQARTDLAAGLRQTAIWYRSAGWL